MTKARKKKALRIAVIPVSGPIEYRDVQAITLELLQKEVGGYIELVRLPYPGKDDPLVPHASMYVNENGRLENMEINVRAAALVDPFTPIVGPAVLVGPPDDDGNSTGLDPQWERLIRNFENTVYGRGIR